MAVELDFIGNIDDLVNKITKGREALDGMADSYDNLADEQKKALGGVPKEIKEGTAELEKQGKTINNLEAYLKRLQKAQQNTTDPKHIKAYNTEIAKTSAAIKQMRTDGVAGIGAINKSATASQLVFRSLGATISAAIAPVALVAAGIAALKGVATLANDFEQTAADLSAITGAQGDALEFLKQKAVEAGIETTSSAKDTLEAYKLIASAKPELLGNADALASITREAITLSEAMGADLPTAATNLTDIMNQFNAPASEAGRFVNALAAGSKEGSAEIGQLAESMKVAGTELRSSNVAFEEGVGLLEGLAEKGKKGSEAGTALRNILSKLSATDILPQEALKRLEFAGVNIDLLSDKSLSFTDRLRALLPVQNDANALTAVFGLENKSTAQILLGSIDRIDELTGAVTGTNTAQEQAATRTATARGEWARLTNTIQALIQRNSSGLSKFFAFIIRMLREVVLGTSYFIEYIGLIPIYVNAAFQSVKQFGTDVLTGFAELGQNAGNIFKELFNFKKLITEGTGDLKKAAIEILANPFKGAGKNAAETYRKELTAGLLQAAKDRKIGDAISDINESLSQPASTDKAIKFVDEKELEKQAEKQKRLQEQAAKEAERLQNEIEKARFDAMKDGVEKQLAIEEARHTDLLEKLKQFGIDETDAIYQHELNKYEIKKRFLEQQAALDNLEGEERINFIYNQTKAEIDAIEAALRASQNGQLAADQLKQINFLRKQASDEYLKQLEDFQSKEQEAAQQHEIDLLELKRGQFEDHASFEEFKEKEILAIRLKYAEQQLAIIQALEGEQSKSALRLLGVINSIKGEIEKIQNSGGAAKEFNIYRLFGLDPDDPKSAKIIDGIETAAETAIDVIGQVNAIRLQSAEMAIEEAEAEIAATQSKIDAKQRELDDEIARGEKGFANDADLKRRELEQLKAQQEQEKIERDKAFEEKKKIQKQQLTVDTITQASSLITAAAQIYQSVANIPFVGVVIGTALVAAMLAAFIAAKAKAFQSVNKQKAEKGMFAIADGNRHSQGGERLGDHVEIEQGEAVGVLSRTATGKYGAAYRLFTEAANSGDTERMATIADMLAGTGVRMNHSIVRKNEKREIKLAKAKAMITAELQSRELSSMNKHLEQMAGDSKKKKIEYVDGKKIIRQGNSTRVIRMKK